MDKFKHVTEGVPGKVLDRHDERLRPTRTTVAAQTPLIGYNPGQEEMVMDRRRFTLALTGLGMQAIHGNLPNCARIAEAISKITTDLATESGRPHVVGM